MPPMRRPATPDRRGRAGRIVRGLVLLGTGRAEGFVCFEGGRDALLSALTPPLAFLLVMALLLLAQKPSLVVVCLLLLFLCGILLPPVLSHLMASLWKRSDRWQRYATASAWSVWLVLPAYLPVMLFTSLLLSFGVGQTRSAMAAPMLLGGYMLWLQWFMAWKGLQITRLQAVLTVAVLTLGSCFIAIMLQQVLQLLAIRG